MVSFRGYLFVLLSLLEEVLFFKRVIMRGIWYFLVVLNISLIGILDVLILVVRLFFFGE